MPTQAIRVRSLDELESRIDYTFTDKELLQRATTHRSYRNEVEGETSDNQRMEFLGDSVIGVVIATELFFRYPKLTEGALSATRASLVNDHTLASISSELELGSFLLLGEGERRSNGAEKPSILADAYEALIAAIFLDNGFEAARQVVLNLHQSLLDEVTPQTVSAKDFKSHLQKWVQKEYALLPIYRLIRREGPEHSPTFVTAVEIDGKFIAEGSGPSKKRSQQDAAKNALAILTETV